MEGGNQELRRIKGPVARSMGESGHEYRRVDGRTDDKTDGWMERQDGMGWNGMIWRGMGRDGKGGLAWRVRWLLRRKCIVRIECRRSRAGTKKLGIDQWLDSSSPLLPWLLELQCCFVLTVQYFYLLMCYTALGL